MKKVLTLIFVFLLSVQAFSQSTLDVIDPAKFNQKLLEQMVQFKVNEYRKSKGLRPMLFNEKLYLAAKDQSDYIQTRNKLTHDQTVKGKETVADRLRFYTKSSNFSVAENIARTYVLIPAYNYDSSGKTNLSTAKTYEEAATFMFNSWKQSSIHNANMLSSDFSSTALCIYFDSRDNSLTAVQVFANYR